VSPAQLIHERPSESGYDVGLHADAAVGPVEVGVSVEQQEGLPPTLGISVEAPMLGRLTLAAIIEADGGLHLAALTRELDGKVAHASASDAEAARLALERSSATLAQERARTALLEAQLAEARAQLAQARAESAAADELGTLAEQALTEAHAARAELQADFERRQAAAVSHELEDHLAKAQDERARAEEALSDAQGGARSLEADKASAEEAARTVSSELGRSKRQVAGLQQSVDALTAELGTLRYAKQELAEQLQQVQEQAAAAEIEGVGRTEEIARLHGDVAGLQAELERFRAEVLESSAQAAAREADGREQVADVERRLALESERAAGYETSYTHASNRVTEAQQKIEALNGTVADMAQEASDLQVRAQKAEAALEAEKVRSAERQGELDEEHRRREELVQDIAYIRSQVTDLASTKGSLLVRLDTMANRETKRQASAREMSSALQDAEAVAADRAMGMRRMQVRAEKLETELAEARAALDAGQEALAQATTLAAEAGSLRHERDELRVQMQFLQKQVGAHQRAKPVAPAPLAAMPAKATPPTTPDATLARTQTALPGLDLPAEWLPESLPPLAPARPTEVTRAPRFDAPDTADAATEPTLMSEKLLSKVRKP
jgi:chromosome segregation ATPase